MKKIPFNAVTSVIEILMRGNAKRATKFISPTQIVRATRRHPKTSEFVLKIGSPNYLERDFIKACKKAGEPFPVRNIQIKFYPEKKKTRAGKRRGR